MRNPAQDLKHPLKKRVTRLRDELGDVVDPMGQRGIIEALIEYVPKIVIQGMDMGQLLATWMVNCGCIRKGGIVYDGDGNIVLSLEQGLERLCELCKASRWQLEEFSTLINNPITGAALLEMMKKGFAEQKAKHEVAPESTEKEKEG